MSGEPDVIHPLRDEAFQLAEDLAAHILESSNAYHALSGQDDFPGRDRMRFVILLVQFEEVGKLMALVRECEKAAKADYINVRIEDFHDPCLNGRRAVAQILEELRTVEQASMPRWAGRLRTIPGTRTTVENLPLCAFFPSDLSV